MSDIEIKFGSSLAGTNLTFEEGNTKGNLGAL